jgi:hypothetical protein
MLDTMHRFGYKLVLMAQDDSIMEGRPTPITGDEVAPLSALLSTRTRAIRRDSWGTNACELAWKRDWTSLPGVKLGPVDGVAG